MCRLKPNVCREGMQSSVFVYTIQKTIQMQILLEHSLEYVIYIASYRCAPSYFET
jgi:hypothetical protein